jgi:F-box-like
MFYPKFQGYFNQLSDEMVLSIFRWVPKQQLNKLALVCKKWRQVAYDDTLWGRLDLGGKTLHARNLEHILKRGVSILRLAACCVSSFLLKILPCDE